MGENSAIEWTDHTFNAWVGCEVVSPACDNCYARTGSARLGARYGLKLWDGDRYFTGEDYWRQPIRWNRAAERAGRRARVFTNSFGDVFEDREGLVERRALLADLVDKTPWLDWLLLTKRPEHAERLWYDARRIAGINGIDWGHNVLVGTTVEDVARKRRARRGRSRRDAAPGGRDRGAGTRSLLAIDGPGPDARPRSPAAASGAGGTADLGSEVAVDDAVDEFEASRQDPEASSTTMTAVAHTLVRTIHALDVDAVADEDLLDPALFALISVATRHLGRERTRAIVEEAMADCESIAATVELLAAERRAAETLPATVSARE